MAEEMAGLQQALSHSQEGVRVVAREKEEVERGRREVEREAVSLRERIAQLEQEAREGGGREAGLQGELQLMEEVRECVCVCVCCVV